ncbi:MAG: putative transport system permease protein, partial [Acidobacteriota bacterium]|nr:putative transport system permease protein [Acidobacteriota bacterium]
GESDPVGQIVRVRKVPMEVVGVLEPKGQSLQGQDQDDTVLMPITTARNRVLGGTSVKLRTVNYISVKVRDGADMAHAEAEMRTLLRQRHRLQPAQDDDFTVRNLSEVLATREESTRIMTLLLAAVASVSLLVGGIGIMNIMLVSVTERTREIGVRKAVGARRQDVLIQFLIEAVTLSVLGGAIGLLLGYGLGVATSHLIPNFPPAHVPLWAVVLAFGFSAVVGIFFGIYPAAKASRLDPIDALRYE